MPELARFTPSRPSSPLSLRRPLDPHPHINSQPDFLSKPTGAASLCGLLTLFRSIVFKTFVCFRSGPSTFTHSPLNPLPALAHIHSFSNTAKESFFRQPLLLRPRPSFPSRRAKKGTFLFAAIHFRPVRPVTLSIWTQVARFLATNPRHRFLLRPIPLSLPTSRSRQTQERRYALAQPRQSIVQPHSLVGHLEPLHPIVHRQPAGHG